jgi:hydrogenase maturation protease
MICFDPALAVADAVLYEGFLLYPYTASARKNQMRWQFGVVVPREYASTGTGEPFAQQTEILLERQSAPVVDVLLRFLHVVSRRVEVCVEAGFEPVESLEIEGASYVTFDETVEREVALRVRPLEAPQSVNAIAFEGQREEEPLLDAGGIVRGRVVRQRWPLRGTLSVRCEPLCGEVPLNKLTVRVENESGVVAAHARRGVLRTAFVSAHTLLHVSGGRFLSVLDPPPAAEQATATLRNEQTWPVLVGSASEDSQRSTLVLSSPIILYDFPAVAPQTEADAFDATEIDELLELSVLGLSDAERNEARATDPRAKAIVERAERLDARSLKRVHAGSMTADPFAALDVPSIELRLRRRQEGCQRLGGAAAAQAPGRCDGYVSRGEAGDRSRDPSGPRGSAVRRGHGRRRSGQRPARVVRALVLLLPRRDRAAMSVLVAGVGNIFFGDDGFGPAVPAVARALAGEPPTGAKVEDFGIRGLHLAYELLAGHERAIVIDAVARGGAPGTLYLIEPDVATAPAGAPDAHRMDLHNVFAFLRALEGEAPPLLIVGCEPSSTAEGIGLSPEVERAIEPAVQLARRLIDEPPGKSPLRTAAAEEEAPCFVD